MARRVCRAPYRRSGARVFTIQVQKLVELHQNHSTELIGDGNLSQWTDELKGFWSDCGIIRHKFVLRVGVKAKTVTTMPAGALVKAVLIHFVRVMLRRN
jgi:hypothetical protein